MIANCEFSDTIVKDSLRCTTEWIYLFSVKQKKTQQNF